MNASRSAIALGGLFAALAFLPGRICAQEAAEGAPVPVPAATPLPSTSGRVASIPILEFTNTDARSVFRLLSEYAGVDIVVDPAVTGTVNAVVTNKTWQEVVRIASKMLNLTVTNENGFLYVQRSEDYQKRLAERAAAAQAQDASVRLQRKIIRIENAKAKDMSDAVKDLLSARGKITVVERTNSLIILDGPEQIAAVEKVIHQLDLETNQVMIEAKLVQIESEALQELGINWQVQSGAGMGWATAPTNGGSSTLSSSPFKGGMITNNTPIASTPAQTVTFGLLNGNLGVAISHLLSTSKAEVLSSPQISTLDNKEAKISMGDQVPILTKDESGNTVTTYVDALTELIVTPQVTARDRVMLNLKPKKNSYTYDANAGVIIKKQEAETNVVVSDGETVVIGGLVSNEQQESETGIPLLKDIPYLGALFRYKRTDVIKKDLVIFVTPRIVRRETLISQNPLSQQQGPSESDLEQAATAPSVDESGTVPAP